MGYDWSNNSARARSYNAMCMDVIALQGYKHGKVPIITRKDHPQEWRDWYAYYKFRQLLFSQELMRERDEKTVPTHSPFDFDAEFSLRYPAGEVPDSRHSKTVDPTPEMKVRAEAIYAAFCTGKKIDLSTDRVKAA